MSAPGSQSGYYGQQASLGKPPASARYHGQEVQQPLNGRDLKRATLQVRRGFVRKVYGLLTAQLLITVVIGAQLWSAGQSRDWLRSHEWLLWLSVFMTLATVGAMVCCQSLCRRYPINMLFLFALTAFQGIMIGFVSAMFTWQTLLFATGLTVLVFTALTLYAFSAATDFTGMGPYLFSGLAVLFLFGLVVSLAPALGMDIPLLMTLYDCLGVLIFTFYIIFDTQLIMGEWGGRSVGISIDEYVFAALTLYMDIVNLFLHLLSLLGDRTD